MIRCRTLAWVLCALMLGARSEALTLVDERVNVFDHPVDFLTVYISSATHLVEGGSVGPVVLYQSSWFEMTGGTITSSLRAYTTSDVYLLGGSVGGRLHASQVATVDWAGGSVGGPVVAEDDAEVRIYGSDFSVDFAPVPYGVLGAPVGTLRGTLFDGTPIQVAFHHAGGLYGGLPATGQIVLVSGAPSLPPPPDFSHLNAILDDGGVHDVDDDRYDTLPLGVRVRSPLAQTTLNLLPGAEIGYSISRRRGTAGSPCPAATSATASTRAARS